VLRAGSVGAQERRECRLVRGRGDTPISRKGAVCRFLPVKNFRNNDNAMITTKETVQVQEITDREQWNTFLSHQPHIHIMQSYEWGELQKYLGARIYRLGALADGELIGILQLLVVAIPLPVSVPGLRFNYLYGVRGPVIKDPDSPAFEALVEYAGRLARTENAVVLRLEPNIPDDDPQIESWLAAYQQQHFHTNLNTGQARRSWVLDIRPDAETLLADFKMTWRQNVRSSQRKGVTVREGVSDQDFDAYYEILTVTSERDDFFVHSKDYHREMYTYYKQHGNAVILLAEHEGEAIAAKMLLRMGDWCWDMFGGSTNHKRNLKATYLIQYQCFLWAKEQGCSFFDFRAIPLILEPGQEMWGVYEFKKGFGGFSRLCIPTQDYVYHPLIYRAWNKLLAMRHERRHKEREKVEIERAERGTKQA
jgi:peptidoglycan pentaglycine glycine transferase (the first glycine)